MKKVKFLQDHRCSPDGATVKDFKKGDICVDMRDSLADALAGSMKIVEIVGDAAGAEQTAEKPAAKAKPGAPQNK